MNDKLYNPMSIRQIYGTIMTAQGYGRLVTGAQHRDFDYERDNGLQNDNFFLFDSAHDYLKHLIETNYYEDVSDLSEHELSKLSYLLNKDEHPISRSLFITENNDLDDIVKVILDALVNESSKSDCFKVIRDKTTKYYYEDASQLFDRVKYEVDNPERDPDDYHPGSYREDDNATQNYCDIRGV